MYIPNHFKEENQDELIRFMRTFSFGTIITANESKPIATHLPIVISQNENKKIVLSSHCAISNPQWKWIAKNEILVIFSEPHAYISPKHYEHSRNVPTWNYMAVHAYGKGKIITEKEKIVANLEGMIATYEQEYAKQWETLSKDYINRLLNGIVSFEIEIFDLQGQMKLSQNKTEVEKHNITDLLAKSPNTNENLIAEYMNQRYFSKND